ncbi:hypothetical protein lerEdw1_007329 [Lerista edwardsae]|nr:hypothetical protein lerEdw1_007329 [Lerista edwardsae]
MAPPGPRRGPPGVVAWLLLAALAGPAGAARVSSSLSTTHHVHHFHNKHGTVPIAINRTPFLTRGGHAVAHVEPMRQAPYVLNRQSSLSDSRAAWGTACPKRARVFSSVPPEKLSPAALVMLGSRTPGSLLFQRPVVVPHLLTWVSFDLCGSSLCH